VGNSVERIEATRNMTDTRRAAAGFLLAPLIVGIVIACIVFVLAAIGEPAGFTRLAIAL